MSAPTNPSGSHLATAVGIFIASSLIHMVFRAASGDYGAWPMDAVSGDQCLFPAPGCVCRTART